MDKKLLRDIMTVKECLDIYLDTRRDKSFRARALAKAKSLATVMKEYRAIFAATQRRAMEDTGITQKDLKKIIKEH